MKMSLLFALSGCLALALAGAGRADDLVTLDPTPHLADSSPVDVSHAGSSYSGHLPRFWTELDFVLVWAKATPLPTLVSSGPIDVLGPSGFPGAGAAGGSMLGGQNVVFNPAAGMRLTLGAWLDCDCHYGVEGTYLRIVERSEQRAVSASGLPGSTPLSIPFRNAQLGQEDSVGIAFARDVNPIAGGANLSVTTRLQSANLNGMMRVYEGTHARTDVLFGYRWMGLDENLFFDTHSTVVGVNNVFRTNDVFRCSNDFHGGQIGLREQVYLGRLFFRATGLVAVGSVHQLTRMNGSLATDNFPGAGGAVQRFTGGYLVLPTNTGRFATDRFAWSPEATVGAGIHVCDWLRLSLSYTITYLSSVARPGDQIDQVINPSQGPAYTGDPTQGLTGPPRPSYQGRSNEYWMMGASVGVEMRF